MRKIHLKFIFTYALGLILFGLHKPVFADGKEALRLYVEGSRLEKSVDYQGALAAYEQSLQAEPRYFYSYRQIGICQQMLGNRSEAIAAFEKYLASKPDDVQVRKLLQALKELPAKESLPVAEEPFRHRFGARLMAGYGFGSCNSSGGFNTLQYTGYTETPGMGFSYGGDITWEWMPRLEVGIGVRPISLYALNQTSSTVSWVNADDTNKISFNTFPVLASLFYSLPLTPKWNLVTGISLGVSPGMDFNYSSTIVYRNTDTTEKMDGVGIFGISPVYGGTLGTEYKMNRSFSLFCGIDLLSAAMGIQSQTLNYYDTQTSTGKKLSETHCQKTFSSNPTQHREPTSSTTVVTNGNIKTTTLKMDWGSGQEVQVTILNTSTFESYTNTSYTYSESSGGNYDVLRLSMMLGVVYRY